MYRIYDTKRRRWVNDVIRDKQDDLYKVKEGVFGRKIIYLNQDRYIFHDSFDLYDKNNAMVFEGDYVQAEVDKDKTVVGLVSFVNDLSAYVILVESTQEFYTLGSEVAEYIQVIGNVFDGYEEVVQNGEQALRSSEE